MKRTTLVRLLPGVLVLALLAAGCQTRLGSLSVAATGNVSLKDIDLDEAVQTKNVRGADEKILVLFLPFPMGPFNLQKAIDDALEKGDGDVMVDVVVYQRWWTALLFGKTSLEVEGNVIKTRGGGR
jgi:hypothetical protein